MTDPGQSPVRPPEADTNLTDLREVSAEKARARIAAELYQARQRRGEDLRGVADILRIRYTYLVAIEEGRFEDLPGSAYVLGFLRSYAGYLGLDPDEIVARFKAEASQFAAPQKLEFPVPAEEGHLPTVPVLVAALVLAGAVYWGWDYLSTADRMRVERVTPVPARLAEEALAPEVEGEPSAGRFAESSSSPPTLSLGASTPWSPEPEAMGGSPLAGEEGGPALDIGQEMAGSMEEERRGPAVLARQGGDVLAQAVSTVTEAVPPPADEERTVAALDGGSAPAETVAVGGGTEAPAAPPIVPGPPAAESAALALAPLSESTVPEPEVSTAALAPIGEEMPSPVEATLEPTAEPPVVSVAAAEAGVAESRPEDAAEVPAAPPQPLLTSTDYVPRVYGRGNTDSRIQVRAKFDSWVQVEEAGGDLLLTRILRPGDVYYVPNRPTLVMRTGNAGALEITVDGEPVPSLGPLGAVLTNIVLDPDTLLAGTAVRAEGAGTEP